MSPFAPVTERFLRYVTIDTRADDRSTTCPSSPGQWELARLLVDELTALGLTDASVDAHGYVMATVPATTHRADVPTIGFIAHLDTSPEMIGTGVKPLVHHHYDGRDLRLPDAPDLVLRLAECPALNDQFGHDIITASGQTLLGADDKAGIAAIVEAAAYLVAHPELPHGPVRLAFTPDEEIGRGADRFDVARFGACCAYTVDGGCRGEVEAESFSADALTVTFHGRNTHPGYAHGRMVNAIKVAAAFVASLPPALSPEATDDADGFVHPYQVDAGVDRTSVRLLLRDFTTSALDAQARLVTALAQAAADRVAGARVDIVRHEQYRNMHEVLVHHPLVVERAHRAVRLAGLKVHARRIRGGTDGSRLSFMGLPTPNLFAGEHNIHSRLEWVSAQDMEKAAETIVHICRLWHDDTVASQVSSA